MQLGLRGIVAAGAFLGFLMAGSARADESKTPDQNGAAGGGRKAKVHARIQAHRQELLKKFDKNGDGKLDASERADLRASIKQKVASGKAHQRAVAARKAKRAALLKKYDKNGDGKLDASERQALRADRQKAVAAKKGHKATSHQQGASSTAKTTKV